MKLRLIVWVGVEFNLGLRFLSFDGSFDTPREVPLAGLTFPGRVRHLPIIHWITHLFKSRDSLVTRTKRGPPVNVQIIFVDLDLADSNHRACEIGEVACHVFRIFSCPYPRATITIGPFSDAMMLLDLVKMDIQWQ